jgi:hypothetical protein
MRPGGIALKPQALSVEPEGLTLEALAAAHPGVKEAHL